MGEINLMETKYFKNKEDLTIAIIGSGGEGSSLLVKFYFAPVLKMVYME